MVLKFKHIPVPGNLLIGRAKEVPEGFTEVRLVNCEDVIFYRLVSGIERETFAASELYEIEKVDYMHEHSGFDIIQKAKPA